MNSSPSSNAIGSAGTYATISRTVAAGAVTIIDQTGNYVACLASSLASFLVSLDGQGPAFMALGIKVRAPLGQVFKNIVIDNSGNPSSPLTVTLAIGLGDVLDNRTTATGDPLDSAALNGKTFQARINSGAVAAQFGAAGLFNPAASGVTGIVRRLKFQETGVEAVGIIIARSTAQFATAQSVQNKKGGAGTGGAGQSAMVLAAETSATAQHFITADPAPFYDIVPYTVAGAQVTIEPKGPYIIPAGFGLGVWAQTANQSLTLIPEWEER